MIRRIAVHRVWDALDRKELHMQVVEVDTGTHRVLRVYPFAEEIRNTEWWGGLILLSSAVPPRPEAEECLEGYAGRMEAAGGAGRPERYAFYVTGFSLADRRFTSAVRITRI